MTYAWAWTIGGVTVGTEETLPASATSTGDTVTCTVTPDDGDDAGAPGSDTVTL